MAMQEKEENYVDSGLVLSQQLKQLRKLREQGLLTEAQYQYEVAALKAVFNQQGQHIGTQINVVHVYGD